MADSPLNNFEWNEATEFPDKVRNFIVSIVGIGKQMKLLPIGTGFVIQSRGDRAIVLTAAHNISEGIHEIQHPRGRSHATTPPEFRPIEEVSAATSALRVLLQNDDKLELCQVAHVAWDDATDLAILTIVPQSDDEVQLMQSSLRITAKDPAIGDIVGVLAFADHYPFHDAHGPHDGTMRRRPILRIGRVMQLHPEGTHHHRSPCVETTIPTFSGMSGGAAFILPKLGEELEVFGILSGDSGNSSNPTEADADKMNRSIAGRSYLRLLPREINPLPDGSQLVDLRFTVTGAAWNEAIDLSRFANDLAWIPEPETTSDAESAPE